MPIRLRQWRERPSNSIRHSGLPETCWTESRSDGCFSPRQELKKKYETETVVGRDGDRAGDPVRRGAARGKRKQYADGDEPGSREGRGRSVSGARKELQDRQRRFHAASGRGRGSEI